MIHVSKYIADDYVNEYTKSATLSFNEAVARFNITANILVQAYTLSNRTQKITLTLKEKMD